MKQGWGNREPVLRLHRRWTPSLHHTKTESKQAMFVAPRDSCFCMGGDAQQPWHQKGSSNQSWEESHLMPLTQALSNNHPSNV